MLTFTLTVVGLLAAAANVVAQDQYTATSAADVYAAQATAVTKSPTSNVAGKAFDRIAIIWLENTDYDMAAGDRKSLPRQARGNTDVRAANLAWLAKQGITLGNYFGVTHVRHSAGSGWDLRRNPILTSRSQVNQITVQALEVTTLAW